MTRFDFYDRLRGPLAHPEARWPGVVRAVLLLTLAAVLAAWAAVWLWVG